MKVWQPSEGDVGTDLTPMIDLVFLLVAFFMSIATVITADLVELSIPVAAEARVPEEKRDRQVISVQSDGSLYFGFERIEYSDLAGRLVELVEESPGVRIFLRADADTPHRYVNEVMASCGQAGIFDLIFAANQS